MFDVLNPETEICRSYILEASAGTGKTFSIENIVVRLLLEEKCTIDQILVVTFTRAATRELRVRIHQLLDSINSGTYEPPYFNGKKHLIHQALLSFDQATIETIHGFCSRMLREHVFEGDVGLELNEQGQISNTLLLGIIRDFFRTMVHPDRYSPAQVKQVLRYHRGQVEELEKSLLLSVKKSSTIAAYSDFSSSFESFKKKRIGYDAETIISEFELLYPFYKKYEDAQEKVVRFAHILNKEEITRDDFDQLIEDDLVFVKALTPDRLKKASKNVPESKLREQFLIHLSPILEEASNPDIIFARMVCDCLEMVEKFLNKEELMRFDDILRNMHHAVQNPLFAEKIRRKYKAAIIDEFQDTDPLQWDIFKKLFTQWDGFLYLVGDPKQSIYGFRNADIYTYLEAAECVGNKATLCTNFRSSPALVKELNQLFAIPKMIPLPRLKKALEYTHVFAGKNETTNWEDPVHFFVARDEGKRWPLLDLEEKYFFPFIVQEIQKLPNKEIAILVYTRFQAQRIAQFLQRYNIASHVKQNSNLTETDAFYTFREFVECIVHPRDWNALKVALGGSICGWSDLDLEKLNDQSKLEQIVQQFYELRQILMEDGCGPFVKKVLQTFHVDEKVYDDLMGIVDLLLKREIEGALSPDGVITFLDSIKAIEFDEALSRSSHGKGIQITTMHGSKRLEFDVVFALGLIERSREADRLILNREKQCLEVVIDEADPRYQLYCEEIDAEKMRQLYVTMTRAKYRLYVPVIDAPNVTEAKPGCASPMELYLKKSPMQFTTLLNNQEFDLKVNPKEIQPYENPKSIKIPGVNRYIKSFTSMTESLYDPSFLELNPPNNLEASDKTIHTLPAGNETGVLLHRLLEKIPIMHYDNIQAVEKTIQPFLYEKDYIPWKAVLAECIYKALHAPLNGFCLADVHPHKIFREIEFLYSQPDGFLKGIIDLVFEHEGKYYLVDWKSNWLGPDESYYQQEHLKKAVEQHHYDLQAEIYKEALQRYLALVDPKACIGGIYYIFLRGGIIVNNPM